MKLAYLILTFLISVAGFAQTIRYVKPVAAGSGDGSSWANASGQLQNMIDASAPGDQVWVAQGVYYPTAYATGCTNCSSSRNYTFSLKSDVEIYGGFQGNEALLSQRQYTLFPTILDGDLDQDGILNSGNVFSVVTALNTNSASVFDGFRVRNGYADVGGSVSAGSPLLTVITSATGGIYCWNAESVIRNCNVSNCWGYSGGGLYSRNSSLQILDCVFEANLNGGGMALVTSTTLVDRCLFINNQAGNYGGGIYNDTPNSTIKNCVFINNSAIRGGGISNYSGNNLVLANCVFAGNMASVEGGAIHNTFFSGANAVNCTFYANTAPVGTLMWNYSSTGSVSNSIVYGHAPGTLTGFSNGGSAPYANNSLLEESLAGSGNVIGNPQFASSTDWDGPDNAYRTNDDGLMPLAGSPAINMGNNGFIPFGITTDITGAARISGGTVNAGAYESAGCIPPSSPSNTTVSGMTCPGSTVALSASGTGVLGWYSASSGGNYLGGGSVFTTSPLAGTTTFYVQDSTCAASPRIAVVAQVGDTVAPGITLPSDTILYVNNGACTVNFTYTVITSDNCGLPSINQSTGLGSGGDFPIGTTQNSFEVTDVSGNTFSASFNVTVVYDTVDTQQVEICFGEMYTIGSSTYGSAGTYIDTLQSTSGCDSLVATQLTVLPISSFSQQLTICAGESVSVGSSVYSLAGTFTDTLQSMNGCDSLVTTELIVLPVSSFSQQLTICAGENVSVGSSVYTVSGTYEDTLQSVNGCDSLITTELVVVPLPDTGITLQDVTLTATAIGMTYQWIDCATQMPVQGANEQSFTPTENGWYAVIVTENSCSDTSECLEINELSLSEYDALSWEISVSPNPADDQLSIEVPVSVNVELLNSRGEKVKADCLVKGKHMLQIADVSPGVYFLQARTADSIRIVRVVVQ